MESYENSTEKQSLFCTLVAIFILLFGSHVSNGFVEICAKESVNYLNPIFQIINQLIYQPNASSINSCKWKVFYRYPDACINFLPNLLSKPCILNKFPFEERKWFKDKQTKMVKSHFPLPMYTYYLVHAENKLQSCNFCTYQICD